MGSAPSSPSRRGGCARGASRGGAEDGLGMVGCLRHRQEPAPARADHHRTRGSSGWCGRRCQPPQIRSRLFFTWVSSPVSMRVMMIFPMTL